MLGLDRRIKVLFSNLIDAFQVDRGPLILGLLLAVVLPNLIFETSNSKWIGFLQVLKLVDLSLSYFLHHCDGLVIERPLGLLSLPIRLP